MEKNILENKSSKFRIEIRKKNLKNYFKSKRDNAMEKINAIDSTNKEKYKNVK